ncbi:MULTISPECIES: hypothetical protein [Paraburkholderia]|uniref:hypothetical protein n=1 Tax=Paraburkholderia TaxID=1822464 RepID=UPI0013A6F586|nr:MULTISPECIES: hypothetical protein [Paraburkholderia]MDH6148135.1 hypothetical protein [Paraburkholderia sp. WSM4179]
MSSPGSTAFILPSIFLRANIASLRFLSFLYSLVFKLKEFTRLNMRSMIHGGAATGMCACARIAAAKNHCVRRSPETSARVSPPAIPVMRKQ